MLSQLAFAATVPPAGGGFVDDVIVIEAPEVDELNSDASLDRASVGCRSELCGDLSQHWAKSLPSGG